MTGQTTNQQGRLLCRPEVMKMTGLASVMVSRFMESGNFPQPNDEFSEVDTWKLSDIDAWIHSRKEAVTALGNGQ